MTELAIPDASLPAKNDGGLDLSQKAIQSAVVKKAASHWLTVIPPSAGGVAMFAWGILDLNIFVLIAGLGAISIGGGWFAYCLTLGKEALQRTYLSYQADCIRKNNSQKIDEIKRNLETLNCKEAEAGIRQWMDAKRQFETFIKVLQNTFLQTELAYIHYETVVQSVYGGILDGLEKCYKIMIPLCDNQDIPDQIKELRKNRSRAQYEDERLTQLESDLQAGQEQLKKVEAILAMGEKALKVIKDAQIALSNVDTTVAKRAKFGLEMELQSLQEMIEFASSYNRNN